MLLLECESVLSPVDKHVDRPSSYPHYITVLNVTDLMFLITLEQISIFEKNYIISINVDGLEMNNNSSSGILYERKIKTWQFNNYEK